MLLQTYRSQHTHSAQTVCDDPYYLAWLFNSLRLAVCVGTDDVRVHRSNSGTMQVHFDVQYSHYVGRTWRNRLLFLACLDSSWSLLWVVIKRLIRQTRNLKYEQLSLDPLRDRRDTHRSRTRDLCFSYHNALQEIPFCPLMVAGYKFAAHIPPSSFLVPIYFSRFTTSSQIC